ncbi:MAG: class I SAM-dependent methyltransferase [Thermomicrobiales bacterium]
METITNAVVDFVYLGSWFDSRYKERLGDRFVSFKMAIGMYLQRDGRVIVETGSLRSPGNWIGDGGSTYVFSEVLAHYGGKLFSCDLDPVVIQTARDTVSGLGVDVVFECGDSLRFLEGFSQEIDLLYLDSFDCSPNGSSVAAQEHNANEFVMAEDKLSRDALVVLDDNHYSNGGKTFKTKRLLLERGWTCLFDGRQSVWLRT